jgi:hypothetical protein
VRACIVAAGSASPEKCAIRSERAYVALFSRSSRSSAATSTGDLDLGSEDLATARGVPFAY